MESISIDHWFYLLRIHGDFWSFFQIRDARMMPTVGDSGMSAVGKRFSWCVYYHLVSGYVFSCTLFMEFFF